MRVKLQEDILFIHHEDLPSYKKGGPVVRNSYFWALKSIACFTPRNNRDWEYDAVVWTALSRMLRAFADSGYLKERETILEFSEDTPIPSELRSVASYL